MTEAAGLNKAPTNEPTNLGDRHAYNFARFTRGNPVLGLERAWRSFLVHSDKLSFRPPQKQALVPCYQHCTSNRF
jgi:hypothetical protein